MQKNKEGGFIGTVVSIVVALAVLNFFFGWNVFEFLKSSGAVEIYSYIKDFLTIVWEKFLVYPAVWFWENVIVGIVWETLKGAYEILKNWVDGQK